MMQIHHHCNFAVELFELLDVQFLELGKKIRVNFGQTTLGVVIRLTFNFL